MTTENALGIIRMKGTTGSLVAFLWIIAGVKAANDLRNETIECIFREYASCYRDIATLGANFTVKYDDNPYEMNLTCRSESKVKQCVENVPPICNNLMPGITSSINGFIHQLCNNKSVEHSNFMNSSVCYNKFYARRYNCVMKYDAGKKTDAKSLCCSNKKTLRCMEEDLRSVCPKNSTEFQGHLVQIYRSHHTVVCGPYMKYCGGASRLFSACSIVVATVVSLLIQRIIC